jgi:alkaline phosphatase
MELTRRSFIGTVAAGLAASACGAPEKGRAGAKEAKNIIFCVSDGMAMSVPTIVDGLSRADKGKPSYWCSLMNEPYATVGLQHTRSLSSVVTDSSAASSTWGSGRRIWNGQVNMFPDGTSLKTIHEIFHEKGIKTGLVTTTTATHATPAGFAASIASRGNEAGIAVQYLERGVDIVLAGGDRFFSPTLRPDRRDLYADFNAKGYTVVKDRDAMLSTKAQKLLGIFSNSHIPYTIDRNNSEDLQKKVPTLAEMAEKAIANLRGSSNGFLLQIEGGKVDHAAHGADAVGMVFDQMAFEDAVKVAVDFALEDGETLVIVTADHATGGPALNGAGDEYWDSTAGMVSLMQAKGSFDNVIAEVRRNATTDGVRDVIKAKYGYEITADEANAIVASIGNDHAMKLSQFMRSLNMTLSTVLSNYSKVGFTCQNHTSDHVLVTSVGPGSDLCGGVTENIAFFDMMLASKGLSFSNPTMTLEEAMRHRGRLEAAFAQNRELYAYGDEPEEHFA